MILMTFNMNFTKTGENILKKLARDKRIINFKSLFFKTSNPSNINFNFLKRFGTLFH